MGGVFARIDDSHDSGFSSLLGAFLQGDSLLYSVRVLSRERTTFGRCEIVELSSSSIGGNLADLAPPFLHYTLHNLQETIRLSASPQSWRLHGVKANSASGQSASPIAQDTAVGAPKRLSNISPQFPANSLNRRSVNRDVQTSHPRPSGLHHGRLLSWSVYPAQTQPPPQMPPSKPSPTPSLSPKRRSHFKQKK